MAEHELIDFCTNSDLFLGPRLEKETAEKPELQAVEHGTARKINHTWWMAAFEWAYLLDLFGYKQDTA